MKVTRVCVLLCVVGMVQGVTLLHDVVYIVCQSPSAIRRYSITTRERLTDIDVKGLRRPRDIAACELTSQLYVCDWDKQSIWRVSSDGEDIRRWWTSSDMFSPWRLSVTSSRLLMTSLDTSELMQLSAGGDVLRRVHLPRYMNPLRHSVESPTGTFIVSHRQLKQGHVSEVNIEGVVLRQSSRSSLGMPRPRHIAVDSQGNIFVADRDNCRILLLDAQLALRRVIIDKRQLNDERPSRLCYIEHLGQLIVGSIDSDSVAVFDVLYR